MELPPAGQKALQETLRPSAPARGAPEPARSADGRDGPGDRELLRRLANVGLPALPYQLVSRCVNLCSAALVGHLGDTSALAAIGLSNVITNVTGFSWLWGLSGAILTKSSQDWGAENYLAVGITLQRSFLILLCFADLPLILVWLSSRHLLGALGQSPDVARLVGLYTSLRAPGILFGTITTVLTRTLNSIGNMRITLKTSFGAAVVNVLLSILLIPRLGFIGAPITITLSEAWEAAGIFYLARRDPDFQRCWPGFRREAFTGWCAFLRISCPSLALLAVEWWTWDMQSFLAGLISPLALATQAVAPNISDLQYCAGQALGTAAATVVGNLFGEGQTRAARRCCRLAMLSCFLLMVAQGALFFLLRTHVARAFTTDLAILDGIARLLPLTLAFSFLDGHQAALTGIIQAAGKQHLAAPLVFLCYWVVGVPLGVSLALGRFGGGRWGLEGLWTGMLVGVGCHFASLAIVVCRLDFHKITREVQERIAREQGAVATPEEGGSTSLVQIDSELQCSSGAVSPALGG